jgi:hypothetical protein
VDFRHVHLALRGRCIASRSNPIVDRYPAATSNSHPTAYRKARCFGYSMAYHDQDQVGPGVDSMANGNNRTFLR